MKVQRLLINIPETKHRRKKMAPFMRKGENTSERKSPNETSTLDQ